MYGRLNATKGFGQASVSLIQRWGHTRKAYFAKFGQASPEEIAGRGHRIDLYRGDRCVFVSKEVFTEERTMMEHTIHIA